ncbi:zf-DNL domain-containing protein, partial [Cephalotus follicularis]
LLLAEPSRQIHPSANAILTRDDFLKRWIQTQTNPTVLTNDDQKNHEAGSLKPVKDSTEVSSHECICETRSMKTFCRKSYENGVVVARCGGCNNLHLIADRLGWFGEPGSIEELLAARGEEVRKGSVDSLNLTPEDLAGKGTL